MMMPADVIYICRRCARRRASALRKRADARRCALLLPPALMLPRYADAAAPAPLPPLSLRADAPLFLC